jgi:hypothetical protein
MQKWNEPTKRAWRRFIIKYFDINNDEKIQWWEIAIPLVGLFIINLIFEVLANLIVYLLF